VPVLLFAGGTTGLVLLGGSEPARGLFASLGETAEASGLSALAFADSIPADAVLAADRLLRCFGASGRRADGARTAGGDAVAASRCGLHGVLRPRARRPPSGRRDRGLLADVPQAKLVPSAERCGRARPRRSPPYAMIGPVVVQHLWVRGDGGRDAAITEATITFAIGACGDGRRVTRDRPTDAGRDLTMATRRAPGGPARLQPEYVTEKGWRHWMSERNPEIDRRVDSLQERRSLRRQFVTRAAGLGLSLL
jgi:hypothetical protein